MKEQDCRVDQKSHQMILYVEKDDGTYRPMRTGSFMVSNYMDDFEQKSKKLEDNAMQRLKNCEISPVGYYMHIHGMTLYDLAKRSGIPKHKVKKHVLHGQFGNIKISDLKKYADVFGIPVSAMFFFVRSSVGPVSLKYEETGNPYVLITGEQQEMTNDNN
jgi:hypothetical protein